MKRRLTYLLIIMVLALPLVGAFLTGLVPNASALTPNQESENNIKNSSLSWVDVGTIKAQVGAETYFFKTESNPDFKDLFVYKIKGYDCFGQIRINPNDTQSAKLDMDYLYKEPNAVNTTATKCRNVGEKDAELTKTIANPENRGISFYLSADKQSVNRWDGQSTWDFAQSAKYPNLYTRSSEADCQDIIDVNQDSNTFVIYELTPNKNKSTGKKPPAGISVADDCYLAKEPTSGVQNGKSAKLGIITAESQNGSGATGGGTSGNINDEDTGIACDYGSSAISWMVCPIVDGLVKFVSLVDGIVTEQLTIETNKIFCEAGDTCQAYYSAWKAFRNIALGLMAVAGLIILIAQALGMEILDAYAIRKTLPRLLIAAIGISLSWPFMQFLVNLTNDLGFGIRHLIYSPFSSLNDTVDLNFGQSLVATIFAGATLAVFSIIGVLSFAATAALAVFIAVLVLVIREIAIIVFITLAPIAIAAYILPNTQKIYKFWWDSFSKALLMFPIIAAFIASGHVFATISLNNKSTLNQMVGFVAYFAPYFLLPLTFRFAGGALAQIGGFVNDRGRGGFDRLRNIRGNQAKKRLGRAGQRATAGRIFKNAPLNSRRAKVNTAVQSAALVGQGGKNPVGMAARIKAARATATLTNTLRGLESSDAFKMLLGDDDASHAMLHGRGTRDDRMAWLRAKGYDEESAKQKNAHIENIIAASEKEGLSSQSLRQAAVLSAVQASTSYDTDPITGERGVGKLLSDIDMVSGGDEQTRAQMVGKVKQLASQAGRGDLSAPFSDEYKNSRNIAMQAINSATTPEARLAAIQQVNESLHDKIVDVEGPGFVLGGKGRMVEELMPAMQRRIQRAAQNVEAANLSQTGSIEVDDGEGGVRTLTADDANREMKEVLASTAGLHDLLSQVSPEKGRLFESGILRQNIPGFKTTVEQEIDSFQSDPDFVRRRSAYERSAARHAAQANSQGMDPVEFARLQQLAGVEPPIPPVPGSNPNG